MHLNVRSLNANFAALLTYLHALDHNFTVLGLTETWTLDSADNDALFNLTGYESIFKSRSGSRGGGVCLYINNILVHKRRLDLELNDQSFESLFIEIETGTLSRNLIIGVIYRPPGHDLSSFQLVFDTVLAKIDSLKKKCVLMGDFNIDLLKSDHQPTDMFLYSLMSNSYLPLIDKATRLTQYSSTLIDNIFSNCLPDVHRCAGILCTDISDHLPIFSFISTENENCSSGVKKELVYRVVNDRNISAFSRKLHAMNWDAIFHESDANSAYNYFINTFQRIYDECFPLVSRHPSKYMDKRNAWLTTALLVSIKRKDKLYKKYLTTKTDHHKNKYCKYRNVLNKLLRYAKKSYYTELINHSKSDPKKTWNIINGLINKKNKGGSPPSQIYTTANNCAKTPAHIAESFNDFFVDIGPSLASKIKPSSKSFSEYLGAMHHESLFFTPVTHHEIEKMVKSFKLKNSSGIDHINQRVIMTVIDLISKPLAHIFNCSISTGFVPSQLKIAQVVPIHKSGPTDVISNYRPISLLPCFSKILEKIVYTRLLDFLDRHNIISPNQFGFRKNCSPELAISFILNKLIDKIEQGEYVAGIFLDLSKAFDTIDHHILIQKLHHYGIRGIVLEWFQSYLSNRKQTVKFKNVSSSFKDVKCGVPQGSILGPLLFILYVNDCINVSKIFEIIMFADDTNIFSGSRDPQILQCTVNKEMSTLADWFQANKLSLNINKTHFMVFGNRKNITLDINIDGLKIDQVDNTKFLGIQIDHKLNWKIHIQNLCKKLSRHIGIINRLKSYLPQQTLLQLYYSFIYPHVLYCILVWGNCAKTVINPLIVLQKRVVRIISGAAFRQHSPPLFKANKILTINDIYHLQVSLFMYRYTNNLLPRTFNNYFRLSSDVHQRSTRFSHNIRLERFRLKLKECSLKISGPNIWNRLEPEFKKSFNINSFKFRLKSNLLNKY